MLVKQWRDEKILIVTWVFLRALTILFSILAAHLAAKPLLSIWTRWDTIYYSRIVVAGYSPDNGTTNFHPLFPYLAKPLWFVGVDSVIALILVSSFATLLVCLCLRRLALFDQDSPQALRSSLLFLFWPISYVLFIPYSESVWLACAVLCLIYARTERWKSAAFAAALATLARQQGLFLVVPLGWELWRTANYDFKTALSKWRDWLSLGMIPFCYVSWILYRTMSLGDVKPNFSSVQNIISSALLSPASHQVVKDHRFTWPWEATYLAIKRAMTLSFVNPWLDLIFGFLFLVLVAFAWKTMRTSYRLYVVVIIIVSFSFHTGMLATGGAYLSLPRHLLLAFPVFIGLTNRIRGVTAWVFMSLGFCGFTFFLFGYFWVRLVP